MILQRNIYQYNEGMTNLQRMIWRPPYKTIVSHQSSHANQSFLFLLAKLSNQIYEKSAGIILIHTRILQILILLLLLPITQQLIVVKPIGQRHFYPFQLRRVVTVPVLILLLLLLSLCLGLVCLSCRRLIGKGKLEDRLVLQQGRVGTEGKLLCSRLHVECGKDIVILPIILTGHHHRRHQMVREVTRIPLVGYDCVLWYLLSLFLWILPKHFILIHCAIQRFLYDLPHFMLIEYLIILENIASHHIGRGKGIWISQQGANGCQDGPYIVDGTPLVLQHCIREGVLSRHIRPSLQILGWNISLTNLTMGGLLGQFSENSNLS